jgi:hypothetical protein
MKQKFCFTFLTLILTIQISHSQAIVNTAFKSGEVLKYKGSYYMTNLWADLAELKMEVSDYVAEGKQLYSLKGTFSTYSNYDSYFKIRDLYQSWIGKTDLKPYIFKRNVDEGGFRFNMKYTIKRAALQAKYDFEKDGNTSSSVIKIKDDTQDLISILYYIRNLDFEKMPLNKATTISVLVDEKINNITLVYKAKETIKNELLGQKPCYKLAVSINQQGLLKKESNFIWLSADKNKIPVQIKAEIPIGSIQIRLIEAKGLN